MRQVVGQGELRWESSEADAEALWFALTERYPALKPLGDSRVLAVNHEHVPLDHPLQDGDEVAFFPPVSGG